MCVADLDIGGKLVDRTVCFEVFALHTVGDICDFIGIGPHQAHE